MLSTRQANIQRFGDARNPDLVYYNADVVDGKEIDEGIGSNPLAYYNETRDTPLIKDCSKYYFSIVRFQMNGSGITIPLFIPVIEPEQSDPNKTIYQIGMSLYVEYDIAGTIQTNTFYASAPITFRSQSTTAPIPQSPVGKPQDFSTDYYYVQDYDHFVDLVNETYQTIWDDLNTQFKAWYALQPGAGVAPDLATAVPKMEYNPDSGRFELYTDQVGWGGRDRTSAGTPTDENWGMYFNSNMFGLFDSFPHEYEGGDLASKNESGQTGFAYEIIIRSKLGRNLYEDPGTSIKYWVTDQNWVSTGSLWSPVASIVFVSTLLPVQNEATGQPISYGVGNTVSSFSSQSAFQPIVTDISLPLDRADQYKGMVTYIPSAEYRLATMTNSPAEIRNVDIQVFWKNRLDGNLVPLRLYNKASISVKVLFRRRDYNLGATNQL